MSRGLQPRKYRDHRRYSYNRTFGSFAGAIPDFIIDTGRKNQNEPDPVFNNPPLPYGCTGFAVAGVAESDVKQRVDPRFTYDKTLLIQNGKEGDECTLQDAYKSAVIYGVRLKGETDADALGHRRAPYFEVHPDNTHDWYDAVLSAVYSNQRPVSLGTAWNMFIENVKDDGIQRYAPVSWTGGHAHNIIGKKTIDGVEYLIDDTWNGEDWGDHGLCYWDRAHFNQLMSVRGTDALTNRPAEPGDIQTVELTILQLLISLYYRLLAHFGSWLGSFAS